MKQLHKVMRLGDKLILARLGNLGSKPELANANLAKLEADGVTVAIMNPDYFSRA